MERLKQPEVALLSRGVDSRGRMAGNTSVPEGAVLEVSRRPQEGGRAETCHLEVRGETDRPGRV